MKTEEPRILDKRSKTGKAEPVSRQERDLALSIMRKFETKYGLKKARELTEVTAYDIDRRAS